MAKQPDLFSAEARRPAAAELSTRPIRWAVWAELGVRFVVRLYLGLLILALPWLPFWTQNNLFTYSTMLSALAGNGFVRGVVSGLGALNILMAVWGVLPRSRR